MHAYLYILEEYSLSKAWLNNIANFIVFIGDGSVLGEVQNKFQQRKTHVPTDAPLGNENDSFMDLLEEQVNLNKPKKRAKRGRPRNSALRKKKPQRRIIKKSLNLDKSNEISSIPLDVSDVAAIPTTAIPDKDSSTSLQGQTLNSKTNV